MTAVIYKKIKAEGKTIQPTSAKVSVTKTTETILPSAEAKQNKTSPLKTETSEETVTIHEHIQKSAQQTAKRFSLQELQARLTVMASSEEKPVLVPAEQLHKKIKSLNTIVNGLSVSGINKPTPTNMAYIINLALDVGFAYCHNAWKPHAAAAKTGNSLGAPSKDDSQRWANRVEACYVEELKKEFPPKTATTNAYWTVTKEFFAGKNMTAKQMRARNLSPKLSRWWHCHYPERNNKK
jgi:biopolymer transport protein ExbD